MRSTPQRNIPRGLTLIELMVVIGVLALLVALTVPSMREMIAQQRLKSINAELVTDLQYARSEAVSRNQVVMVLFGTSPSMSCYVLFIDSFLRNCDCSRPPGSVCTDAEEIRTTQVPASTGVSIFTTPANAPPLAFNKEGMRTTTVNDYTVEASRASPGVGRMKVTINSMGRPTVCSPDASVTGVPPC